MTIRSLLLMSGNLVYRPAHGEERAVGDRSRHRPFIPMGLAVDELGALVEKLGPGRGERREGGGR